MIKNAVIRAKRVLGGLKRVYSVLVCTNSRICSPWQTAGRVPERRIEFLQLSDGFMLSQFLKLEVDVAGMFNRKSPFCVPHDTNLTLLDCMFL